MSLKTVLFVSESLLQGAHPPALDELIQGSGERNAAHGITGAMISARGHFAEVLEGPASSLDPLMDRILCDPRHRHVRVVLAREIPRRQFARWSMILAYAGESFYVTRHITPLLSADAPPAEQALLASQLFHVIRELAHAEKR